MTARNVDTGVATTTRTNRDGSYSFPDLPIGHYNLQVESKGFAVTQETGIVLDVNAALRLDVALQLSSVNENVEVQANAVQVDTISTQLGDVIGSTAMTSLPLNGRAYTDLLALQPGVVPQSNESTNGLNSYSNAPPSGGLNDGTLSISGARGSSNGFMVNGGNVQEQMANGTAIIPNVDSIDEFRIITNNFDAEYGHYSGGLVNVITKSGTNRFHGERLRLSAQYEPGCAQLFLALRAAFITRTSSAEPSVDRSSTTSCSSLPTTREPGRPLGKHRA